MPRSPPPRVTCCGRTPTARRVPGPTEPSPSGTASVWPTATATLAVPSWTAVTLPFRKFICGAPMKPATKRLAGRLYSSSGEPTCSMRPARSTEVRERLLEQEGDRPAQDGAAGDTLALAAGELAGAPLQQLFDLEHSRLICDARGDLRLWQPSVLQPEGEVLAHAHVRVERVGLEHHGQAAVGGGHGVSISPDCAPKKKRRELLTASARRCSVRASPARCRATTAKNRAARRGSSGTCRARLRPAAPPFRRRP